MTKKGFLEGKFRKFDLISLKNEKNHEKLGNAI